MLFPNFFIKIVAEMRKSQQIVQQIKKAQVSLHLQS